MKNWNVKLFFSYAFFLSLLSVSCTSPTEDVHVLYGQLSVSLAQPEVQVVTRAAETLPVDDATAKDYVVSLYNAVGELKHSDTYDKFGNQKLPFGTYYVTAQNCTEAEAEEGNGRMRLYGRSADVELTQENLIQEVSIECDVQNAKFTVAFSEEAANNLDDLQVVLSRTSPARTITVSKADGETECWFNPGEVVYTITGSFRGKQLTKTGNVTLDVKSNVKLQVKINLEKGELFAPDVTFQNTIDNESDVPSGFNPYK